MCTCISYMPLRTKATASRLFRLVPASLPFKPLSNEQMKSGCLSLCIQAAPLCGRFVCLSRTLSPHLHLCFLLISFIMTHFKRTLRLRHSRSLSLSLSHQHCRTRFLLPIEFSCNDSTRCRTKLIAFAFLKVDPGKYH